MNRTDTVGVTESVFNLKYKAVCQSVDEYYIHSVSPNDKIAQFLLFPHRLIQYSEINSVSSHHQRKDGGVT